MLHITIACMQTSHSQGLMHHKTADFYGFEAPKWKHTADFEMDSGGKLLIVGLACIDIINVAEDFPSEDTDQQLLDQQVKRGGNATNTSVVLSQLGSNVEWLGTLATDQLADVIIEDLDEYGVLYDNVKHHGDCDSPLSCVIVNASSGSRTILHKNKTLPEVEPNDFLKIDLSQYSWIHFEGRRNQLNVEKMISIIETYNERRKGDKAITVSLEAEKFRNVSQTFLQKGDVVFVSKDYSRAIGFYTAEECLNGIRKRNLLKEGARAICAWGEKGAWGSDENGGIVHSPAFPPKRVVDTLGAGDTFNAGVLHALNKERTLEEALKLGCKVAGQKVGHIGFKINASLLDLS